MDIIKYDVYRGPNIGIYINTNDDFVLVPMGFAQTKAEKLGEYLKAQVVYSSVANTRLLGALMVMNNKGILLPKTAYMDEYEFLKKETKMEIAQASESKYCIIVAPKELEQSKVVLRNMQDGTESQIEIERLTDDPSLVLNLEKL